MKSTGLKRGSELRRKTALSAGSELKRKPMKRKAKRRPAAPTPGKAFASQAYIDWLKTLPCCNCQAPADDPHHLIGLGGMSGTGMTAPDSMAMPVCRPCHDEIHATPELWPRQWEWIARTLEKALRDGVLTLAGESS